MGAFTHRDFATLLDEVIASTELQRSPPQPTIPFDLLGVATDPSTGTLRTCDALAAADYLFATAEDVIEVVPPPSPDLSIDPLTVVMELGLSGRESIEDLDQRRREFAFANHPDRMPADLYDVAMARMQIANRAIDDAKAKLVRN